MAFTDPIADMLTRIRNGLTARHETVSVPMSITKKAIADILVEEGYIKSATIVKDEKGVQDSILIELKYEKNADTAIAQIHRQKYPDRLELYKGNLILVGINYDRAGSNDEAEFKHHNCEIEKA